MTREMQDGINSDAAGMNHSIALVAFYIDGIYAWTGSEIALFPHSVHVRIAVHWTTRDGHVIDCETGDATPAQAAAWAHQRRLDGYAWPTVYCSVSAQAAVIVAFQAIHEPLPLWWLAHYDNVDVLPPGCVAKQYADPGPLDKSVVADFWPGVDQGGNVSDPLDELIARQGTRYDGTPEVSSTTLRAEAAWDDSHWDQVIGGNAAVLAAVKGVAVQVAALSGALTAEESALLAAIKAEPAAAPPDPTAVAIALEAAGLPGQIITALLAVLTKAASTSTS